MNGRMSPAQREAMIRRTVYVSDIDQQVKSYVWLVNCLNYLPIYFIFLFCILYLRRLILLVFHIGY
jgi:hypothetical protein